VFDSIQKSKIFIGFDFLGHAKNRRFFESYDFSWAVRNIWFLGPKRVAFEGFGELF
jgi:hypothetical protein